MTRGSGEGRVVGGERGQRDRAGAQGMDKRTTMFILSTCKAGSERVGRGQGNKRRGLFMAGAAPYLSWVVLPLKDAVQAILTTLVFPSNYPSPGGGSTSNRRKTLQPAPPPNRSSLLNACHLDPHTVLAPPVLS